MTPEELNREKLEELGFIFKARRKPGLGLVLTDTIWIRDWAYGQVARMFPAPDFQHTRLDYTDSMGSSLHHAMLRRLAARPTDLPEGKRILHVFGLAPYLMEDAASRQQQQPTDLLRQINFERELIFQETPANILLWLDKAYYQYLRRHAADFDHWITAFFDFKTPDSLRPTVEPDFLENPEPEQLSEEAAPLGEKEQQRVDELVKLYDQKANEADSPRLRRERYTLLTEIGSIYKEAYHHREALQYFEQARPLADEGQAGWISLEISDCYKGLGDLEKARAAAFESLKLREAHWEANKVDADAKNEIAVAFSRLGDLENTLGNPDKALRYFEQYNALEKALYEAYPSNVGFKNGLAVSYSQLGRFSQKQDDLSSAKAYFLKCQTIWRELVDAFPAYQEFQNNLDWVNKTLQELDGN